MSSSGSPMRDFFMRHREGLLLVILVLSSLLIISRQVQDPTGMSYFRRSVITIAAPFQNGFSAAIGGVRNIWGNYLFLFGTRAENIKLRKEVNQLRSEAQNLREELYRVGRLKEFSVYRFETGLAGMAAQVIGESPDPWTRTIVVNRGTQEGLRRSLPVVTPDGLVGSVIQTSDHSSIVRLIVDRSSRVPVLVSRSRARAILEGETSGTCQLKYLDRTEDVQQGDIIITSGLAGIYPRGIEVGTITQIVTRNYGLYQYAKVLPKAPINRLEDVLIIRTEQDLEEE
jgi:rod shape-determining protein MreC